MATLFNDENSDSETELKINTGYADTYNNWRQKEELNKLKTKYGDINPYNGRSDESSSSDTSSEEEEEQELTEQFDKDFYKTLACLKKKDPKIYDKNVTFFDDTNQAQELHIEKKQQKLGEKSKKNESLYIRDYERKIIVERGGKFSDSEDEDAIKEKVESCDKITYVKEQQNLKESFKRALLDDEQADDTNFLKPKTKSATEKEKEEADYREWLKGQELEINVENQEELKPLRDFWSNPNLDTNEKFLRDYVLNNKYMDKDYAGTDLDIENVIHDSDENLSEDEKNIEKQEEFEHKYNFRFEEPDQEFIKRYPRTMENSMRKKDTRRAQKRAEVKTRKEQEKLRKKEELMQLKALKRKEIEEKIEKLKEITGNDDIKFNDIDLDGDFDPNEHDRKMTEIFNEDYYAHADEDIKPEFPDIDEELEIEQTWDNYNPSTDNVVASGEDYEGPHCEDPDFNMDVDYDGQNNVQKEVEGSKKRKRKRKSKFAELISKEKPKFDPAQYQSYEEYFDKYYSLNYEDMIGDLPCRFKYRKVVPNDYGLSVEEILMADDKELNKWCSLKKALQYKPEHVELNDVQTYKQKSQNEPLKKKVLRSLYTTQEDEEDTEQTESVNKSTIQNEENTKIKNKRRRNKKKHALNNISNSVSETNCKSSTNVQVNGVTKIEQNGKDDLPEKKQKRKVKEHNDQPAKKKVKVEKSTELSSPVSSIAKATSIEKDGDENHTESKLKISKVSKKEKSKKKFEKGLKSKNSKRNDKRETNTDITSLNPERLKTYGINPKKLKNKLKYGNKQ